MSSNSQNLKSIGLKATLSTSRSSTCSRKSKPGISPLEDVYRLLIAEDMDIGLATVYRVLTQFEQAGLLERHGFRIRGQGGFELNEGNHHDHLVCLQCGRLRGFFDARLKSGE